MSTAEYYEVIINVIIGLTMIALFLLFLYMVYGGEEQTAQSNVKGVKFYRWILFLSRLIS